MRGIGQNLLNKFLSLHMLTVNRVVTFPTVSSGYSELYFRSGAQSERSRSGERGLQK